MTNKTYDMIVKSFRIVLIWIIVSLLMLIFKNWIFRFLCILSAGLMTYFVIIADYEDNRRFVFTRLFYQGGGVERGKKTVSILVTKHAFFYNNHEVPLSDIKDYEIVMYEENELTTNLVRAMVFHKKPIFAFKEKLVKYYYLSIRLEDENEIIFTGDKIHKVRRALRRAIRHKADPDYVKKIKNDDKGEMINE